MDLRIQHMRVLLVLILGMMALNSYAQPCPKVLDNEGDASSNPYWYSCAGGDFTFNLQTSSNWGDVMVNWGDGTAVQSITAFNSGSIVPHIYAAAVDTFVVTISQVSSSCVVTGVVVMEQPTAASIQIPFGFDTQACVPASLFFTNSSTNVSATTVFEWDFGDGQTATFDASNLGQTIEHFYEPGTVNCETEVTLTAENYCNSLQGNPSIATFNPIHLWDKDQPNIATSNITKCYPDTTFSFTNSGTRNCYNQGNIYPRLLQWTFGTQAEVGSNTTTPWYPFPPNTPRTAAFPGIGDYTIILLDSSYCGIATDTQIVHIVAPPIAEFSISQDTVCVGQNVTFTPLNIGGNTYAWNFNGTWTTFPSGPVNYSFASAGTYTVQFRISESSSPQSCVDVVSHTIIVLPAPSATITYSNDVGCDSLQVTFGQTSVGSPTSFQWNFDNGQTFTGPNPPAQWFIGGGQYDVVLNVAANNGCVGTATKTITINDTPTAGFSVSNPCVGQTVTFYQESTGNPSNYNWVFGNTLTSTQSSPTTTYNTAGDYNVRLIARRGTCRDTLYQTITVYALPTAQFTSSVSSGCSPLLVDFTNASTGAVSYSWNFGDTQTDTLVNTSHTFYALGSTNPTYNIQLTATSEYGCSHTVSHPVTVIAGALADFHLENATPTCSPQAVSFVNDSQNAVSYEWNFDDSQTSTDVNPDHVFNATGVNVVFYDVQLIAYSSGACHDTTTQSVAVFPSPNFNISTENLSGCSPLTVTMPFVLGATQFQWNFGDGGTSTLPQPQHTFVSPNGLPVTYNIQLIARSPFGCYDTLQSTIDVAGAPTANFTINMNQACEPAVVEVYNNSVNGTDFTWNWGDGTSEISNEDTLTHTFSHPDDFVHYYNINLSTSSVNGCSSTATENFTLYPEVLADFSVMNPSQNCSPFAAAFQNNSTAAQNYQWTFGDGSTTTEAQPNHTYLSGLYSDTTYTAQLNASSNFGCSDTAWQTIAVDFTPTSTFTMPSSEGCEPATVTFVNQSTGNLLATWNWGDGNIDATNDDTLVHVYTNPDNLTHVYNIALTVATAGGCSNTSTQTFTMYPEVTADFSVINSGENCAPFNAGFQNNSIAADQYVWTFGDGTGSTLNSPTHTYANPIYQDTTYQVMLVALSNEGCKDTLYQNIDVSRTPVAFFAITDTSGCYPVAVTLDNGSVGADSYSWNYGTGETSINQEDVHVHNFFNLTANPVVNNITLTAMTTSGCYDHYTLPITIPAGIEADFTYNPEGCSPFNSQFLNQSNGANTYQWDFGDGTQSTAINPAHEFTTVGLDTFYTVTLTAFNNFGCSHTLSQTIHVYPVPVAGITATPNPQTWPQPVAFQNNSNSQLLTNYIWDLGDGTLINAEEAGDHNYATWGNYSVLLLASNGHCSDTAYTTVNILAPDPVAGFIGDSIGCAPLVVAFQDTSMFAQGWLWDFGDGGASINSSPVHVFDIPGTYDIRLVVIGYNGTMDTATHYMAVTVHPRAEAAFTVTPEQVVIPQQPVFTVNISQDAQYFEWQWGDGDVDTTFEPTHKYTAAGLYDITLIANNEFNCPDTLTQFAAVKAIGGGSLEFPDAFTPSLRGPYDGNVDVTSYDNDIFFPKFEGIETYTLHIYDKWGELIFESKDILKGWDGYYREQICQQDVYIWKADGIFQNGQSYSMVGQVTLIRK